MQNLKFALKTSFMPHPTRLNTRKEKYQFIYEESLEKEHNRITINSDKNWQSRQRRTRRVSSIKKVFFIVEVGLLDDIWRHSNHYYDKQHCYRLSFMPISVWQQRWQYEMRSSRKRKLEQEREKNGDIDRTQFQISQINLV